MVVACVRRLNPLLSEAGFSTRRHHLDGDVAHGCLNPLLSEAGFSTGEAGRVGLPGGKVLILF